MDATELCDPNIPPREPPADVIAYISILSQQVSIPSHDPAMVSVLVVS